MDNIHVMNKEDYFSLGKQYEGKYIIRKQNGYCCMKVNKVVVFRRIARLRTRSQKQKRFQFQYNF